MYNSGFIYVLFVEGLICHSNRNLRRVLAVGLTGSISITGQHYVQFYQCYLYASFYHLQLLNRLKYCHINMDVCYLATINF